MLATVVLEIVEYAPYAFRAYSLMERDISRNNYVILCNYN